MQKQISSTSSNKTSQKSDKSSWSKNKIGSLWHKKNNSGKNFLSGEIVIDGKKIPCLIFKNDFQEGNTPHFHIYSISEDPSSK